MPVQTAKGGKRWGRSGKVYRGKGAAKKALKQGVAVLYSQGKIKEPAKEDAAVVPSQFGGISPYNPAATGLGGSIGKNPARRHKGKPRAKPKPFRTTAHESGGLALIARESGVQRFSAPALDKPVAARKIIKRPDVIIVPDVCILGPESYTLDGKLRREYTAEAMLEAAPRYEGVVVNGNHPPAHDPAYDRPIEDRLGKFKNVGFRNGRIRGDLWMLPSHPMAQRICEAAQNPEMSDLFGFSHDADLVSKFDQGHTIVTNIPRVRCVDLVADSATTHSIFESQRRNSAMADDDLAHVIAQPAMEDLSGGETLPTVPTQEDSEVESHPLDAVVDDILSQFLDGEIQEGDAVSRFKQALKLYPQKADEEEESAGEKEAADDDEGQDGGCESAVGGAPARPARPQPGGKCSWKQAMAVLEKAGAPINSVNVEAIRHLESAADRDALAANLKPAAPAAAGSGARPRSGDNRSKPDSTPARGTESAASGKGKVPEYDPQKARAQLYGRG